MAIKKPKLSSVVQRQLPEFIREDYTAFVAFIEAYYEFMRQNYDVDVLSVRDIDNTLDEFIKYFKREFAIDIPPTLTDDRFLISKIKDYYLTKGTAVSFEIMLTLLFGKAVTVDYPSRQMLRASDGKWNQDVSIFAKVNAGNPQMVIGRLVDVVTPTKIIRVQVDKTQNIEIEVDRVRQIATDIFEFYIDRRFFGDISVGDRMRYADVFDATILSTTSKVEIQRPGKNFKAGELYEIKNGNGTGSVIKVSRVDSNGSIEALEFVRYGIGYSTDFTATLLPIGGTSAGTAGSSSLTIGGTAPDFSVGIGETTNGFFEQGFINTSDYIQPTEAEGEIAWDGTYVGDIVREFYADNKGIILDADEPAVIKIILGPLTKYPGYYTSNDGFLSDAIFIQDSHYYQAYSYVLKIDERLESYKSVTKSLLHPAGMALFGEYDIRNEFNLSTQVESMLKYLVLTNQDHFLASDLTPIKDFTKVRSDSVSLSEIRTNLVSKPLGSQTMYDLDPEDTKVTIVDNDISSRAFSKALNGHYLNDGVTRDDNTVTATDNGISSRSVGKALNGHHMYGGVTLDSSSVSPTESISSKEFSKVLESDHIIYNGVTTDPEKVTITESSVRLVTKYMDSEGIYPHYLNDGTTLDEDKATMADSGGSLWLNPYTNPYPTASSYFLNDSGDYTVGESAFTG